MGKFSEGSWLCVCWGLKRDEAAKVIFNCDMYDAPPVLEVWAVLL